MARKDLSFSDSNKRYLVFALLALLGFIIYSNTLNGPFVFDDHEAIEENAFLFNLSNFRDISGARYLTYLSFALNYAVGKSGTLGYHIVNVSIHVLNSILVFLFVSLTFRTPVMRRGGAEEGGRIAIAAAFLFLVHPVQTGAVSYLSQRFASLAALFYLSSLVFYIKARLSGGSAPARRGLYAAAIVFAIAAQKTKEISFTLPAVIALYEFAFFEGETVKKRFVRLIPFLLCFAIIPAARFNFVPYGAPEAAGPAASGVSGKMSMMLREETATLSRHDYLITQFRVIVTYLRLIVLPVGQNADYDYPVYRTVFAPQALLSFVFLASAFVFSVLLFVRSKVKGSAPGLFISFGLLWFFITISVESSVIPIADIIFEHRLYLPGAGLLAALAALFFHAGSRLDKKGAAAVIAAAAVAVLSVAAYERNFVWADELTLWQDVTVKSPNKARGYNNAGYALVRKGRAGEAIPYFEKTLALKPDFFGAYNNIGNILSDAGRFDESIKYFRKAVELRPRDWRSLNNLGYALAGSGRFDEAVESMERAVKMRPDLPQTHANLGFTLARMGRPQEAIVHLQEAVRLDPGSADAHNNLANAYLMLSRLDEAISHYRSALSISPGHANAAVNLANALKLAGPGGR